MSYCVRDDVLDQLPQRSFDTIGKPSLEQIDGYVTDIAAEIDSALSSAGLIVPVTEPAEFVGWLKHINAFGAAARAERAAFPEASGPGETPNGGWMWSHYQKVLEGLRSGRNIPPTALRAGVTAPYSPAMGGDWPSPVFRMDPRRRVF